MNTSDRIIAINSNAYTHILPQYRYKTENWGLPPLMNKPLEEVIAIKNEIKKRVKELITRL